MNKIEITLADNIGGLRFTLLPKSHLWMMAPVRPTQKASGKLLAKHLSVPLRPRDDGEFRGKSGVHLKYADGRRVWLNVDFYTFGHLMKLVSDGLAEHRRANTFPVLPELLAALGMSVMLPRPSLVTSIAGMFGNLRRKYRLSRSDMHKLVTDHVEVASAERLRGMEDHSQPIPVFGLPMDVFRGPEGWLGAPRPTWDIVTGLFRGHLPPEFWGKLDLVSRELGVPLNEPMATWAREAPAFVIIGTRVVRADSVRP